MKLAIISAMTITAVFGWFLMLTEMGQFAAALLQPIINY